MSVEPDEVAAFRRLLEAGERHAAERLALQFVDEGMTVVDVLLSLVAPAQREVGERWLRNEISVAEEHAATSLVDAVVSVVSGGRSMEPQDPQVVVTCAEGEWHLLPPRLLVETLRAEGFAATFVGGSMPTSHLRRFLERAEPDVVGVSCSTALSYGGVRDTVEVAHDLGVPVLAGGRGLGSDDVRASVLGADLWAPDAGRAIELLRQPLPRELRDCTADTGGALELSLHREDWVTAAVTALADRLPAYQDFTPDQRARTREDFEYILRYVEAAVLTRDQRVFDEFRGWLDLLLGARGLPRPVIELSFEILREVTSGSPTASAVLGAG